MEYSAQYLLNKARETGRERGLRGLLWDGITFLHVGVVRPLLPGESRPEVNGVEVGSSRYGYTAFDRYVPWSTPHLAGGYKERNIELIQRHIEEGERVAVIGGGVAVTTVTAARAVGEGGSVTSYEGSTRMFSVLEETIAVNDVEDIVTPEHAIVGSPIDVSGDTGDATFVNPAELEGFDVLEMDCEGAELSILGSMTCDPRLLIVETHPDHGATTEDVQKALEDEGYETIERKPDPVGGDIIAATKSR